MLSSLRQKIRALVEDFSTSSFETFEFTTSPIFTICQSNITITQVLLNGIATEDYSFSSSTNKITLTASGLASGDIVEVNYTFNKYSDTELNEYIRGALVWLSMFNYGDKDFELETTAIQPTPDNKDLDLISIVSSILVKPDWTEYRLPNLTVKYPSSTVKPLDTTEKIKKIVFHYKASSRGLGAVDVIQWD